MTTTRSNAHDICQHPATAAMRNKCRKVRRTIRDELSASTNAILETKIGAQVIGWRTEDNEVTGPKLHTYVGTLERSYQHRDGFTVWIVVSDERPQGTGHLAAYVHVVSD
jgi:hypothetical protein